MEKQIIKEIIELSNSLTIGISVDLSKIIKALDCVN